MPATARPPTVVVQALLALLLAPLFLVRAAAQESAGASSADLLIRDVHVVDVRSGRVLRDRTVRIEGGEIVRVAGAKDIDGSRDVRTLDGADGYLIPGLWDMHAHLRAAGLPPRLTTDWLMPLLVAHGVTGVRDMNSACDGASDGPVCLDTMRDWQRAVETGALLGPRLLALSSFQLDPPWDYQVTEEQARGAARMLAERDLDFIKVYDRLERDAFFWLMDASRGLDIEVAGHVPLRVHSGEASRAGFRSIEHGRALLFDCYPGAEAFRDTTRTKTPSTSTLRAMVDEHDPARCRALFDTLVRNDTWYVPTHVTRRMDAFADDSSFRHDPRNRYVPAPLLEAWNRDADEMVAHDPSPAGRAAFRDFYLKGLEVTGAAHRAGVGVLVGTDGGDTFVYPGSSLHDELGELVKAGLSPADALRAATWKAAEFLGLTDCHGSVEVGKRADLVLLEANPLESIENVRGIRAVVFGGELLDRERLDRLLGRAEETAAKASDLLDEDGS